MNWAILLIFLAFALTIACLFIQHYVIFKNIKVGDKIYINCDDSHVLYEEVVNRYDDLIITKSYEFTFKDYMRCCFDTERQI